MYGATVELTQSGLTPAWSKDTWSFILLDIQVLKSVIPATADETRHVPGHTRNVTFLTPALRARLECDTMDYLLNTSAWLQTIRIKDQVLDPLTNKNIRNATSSPPGLVEAYMLRGMAGNGPRRGSFVCCSNETDGIPGVAAIGYWSNRLDPDDYNGGDYSYGDFQKQMTMTAKWIVGRPLDKLYRAGPSIEGNQPVFIWSEQPKLLMMNCTPFIERASASVVAEIDTGNVLNYEILDTPRNATEAWLDNYLDHNMSVDYHEAIRKYTNTTASWGYVFWDALLNSGRALDVDPGTATSEQSSQESLEDRSFNFRIKGLNVDLMSYSMAALANNSKDALLDPGKFVDLANKTFGIFFKHFASDNVSSLHGGGAYQPLGEKLPWSLGPVMEVPFSNDTRLAAYQGVLGLQNDTVPAPEFVSALLHIPVEQLVMSKTAVYLCLSLLVFLLLVTVIMYITNRGHYKQLPRNVDTLASQLAFVHGSEKLQAWVKTAPPAKPWYKTLFSKDLNASQKQVKVRLGSFTDPKGVERWGIELVDSFVGCEHHMHGASSSSEVSELQHTGRDDTEEPTMRDGLLGDFDWENRSSLHAVTERTDAQRV